MVRVDLDALLCGVASEGELCEIPGYGPVPVSVVEDLVATGNAFIIAVVTKAQAVVAVSHLGRHPNAYQRSALDFLHTTCAVEGPKAPVRPAHRHLSRPTAATTATDST